MLVVSLVDLRLCLIGEAQSLRATASQSMKSLSEYFSARAMIVSRFKM